MKNILSLTLIVILITSCNKTNIEPIKYDLPQSIVGDVPLENYFEEYALEGGKVIAMSKSISSGGGIAKMAKTTAQMSKSTERLKELKALQPEIEASLSEQQIKDFKKLVYILDVSIGQMKTDLNAIDDSEIAAIQAKKSGQQKEVDSIKALREEAIAHQKAEGTYVEPSSKSKTIKMPKFMDFVFPILGFILFGFFIFLTFKRMKNKVSEIGYVVGDAKNAMGKLKDKVKEGEAEGKTLTDEEKKGIEFLDNFLNKK